MSTNHTENYNLCQWEATDQVLRSDFNQDNAKIDAALAELSAGALKMKYGYYWGTGTASHTLELPFRPKFMWIQEFGTGQDDHMILIGNNAGLSQAGKTPSLMHSNLGFEVDITDTGITTRATGSGSAGELARIALNINHYGYHYVAFG